MKYFIIKYFISIINNIKMSSFKDIWNIDDIKNLIIEFLKYNKCKWCDKRPKDIYNKIKKVSLYTNGICNDCLIKEYDGYL